MSRRFASAVAVLAVLVAFSVACGSVGNSGDVGSNASSDVSGAGPDLPAESPSDNSAAGVERKIVVNSAITLEVPDLRESYLDAATLARSVGGFTGDSRINDSERRASLRLRVPATRHDDVMTGLRRFDGATVKGEETKATEVTEEYADLESSLRNLQATETQLQMLLTRATTVDEILKLNDRMSGVRTETERVTGRIRLLGDLTDFATINVTLSSPLPSAQATDSGGLRSPVEVFRVAFQGGQYFALAIVNIAAVFLGFSIWALPLMAVGLLVWRLGRRWVPAVKQRLL